MLRWVRVVILVIVIVLGGIGAYIIYNLPNQESLSVETARVSSGSILSKKGIMTSTWRLLFPDDEPYSSSNYIYEDEQGQLHLTWIDNKAIKGKEHGAEFLCGVMKQTVLYETDGQGKILSHDPVLGHAYYARCNGSMLLLFSFHTDLETPFEMAYRSARTDFDIKVTKKWLYQRSEQMSAGTIFVLMCHVSDTSLSYTFTRQQ